MNLSSMVQTFRSNQIRSLYISGIGAIINNSIYEFNIYSKAIWLSLAFQPMDIINGLCNNDDY